jgi:hypothetical protein
MRGMGMLVNPDALGLAVWQGRALICERHRCQRLCNFACDFF